MLVMLLALAALMLVGCPEKPLSDAHRGESIDCKGCHVSRYVTVASAERCLRCHEPIKERIAARRGYHASPDVAGQRCGVCHIEHRGPSLAGWRQGEEEFRAEHAQTTGFPLRDRHEKTKCVTCHTELPSGRPSYLAAQPACESCHAGASPHGALRNNDCKRCHAETGWRPVLPQLRFDHQKDTRYPLERKHLKVDCAGCHRDRKFRISIDQYGDCAPCHKGPHGGSFGKEPCRTCHEVKRDFADAISFDHDRTRFPLRDGHDLTHMRDRCQSCHKRSASAAPALACAPCHKTPHGARFNRQPQCATCHVGATWSESVFNHGKQTRFLLTANHATSTLRECRECHRGRRPAAFEDLRGLVTGGGAPATFPIDCLGCHRHAKVHARRYTSAQCLGCHEIPGKEQLKPCRDGSGERDAACLKKMTWLGHGPDNPFPLTGGHDLARLRERCLACHRKVGQAFDKLPADCVSCHKKKDVHLGKLGSQCEACHDFRTSTWKNTARFDHQRTAFPLLGAHETTACARCHPGNNLATRYKPRPVICGDAACHQRDDAHKGKLGVNCGDAGCHDPRRRGWSVPRGSKP